MSNFQCPHCGMTNIDCGKGGFKTPREIELEQKLNAQFAEMEEKLTAEENKNFELKEKLKIAKEALQYYADGEDMDEAKIQGSGAWRYVVDDNHTDTAKQALKQMEEVK